MALVILQKKLPLLGREPIGKHEIRASITRPTNHKSRRDSKATLRVTFGAKVKCAERYCLGVDDGKIVLVPCDDNTGYVASHKGNCSPSNKTLRIDLNETASSMFGKHIIGALKESTSYTLSARMDDNQYVWIEGNE